MNKNLIGSMVNYERTKKEIRLNVLTEGISSPSVIQRLEKGERLPDFFVLERIVERLGRSINKLELLQNESVYEIYYLREEIEGFLEEKEYDEAELALEYYATLPKAKEPLHSQYVYKMKAVIVSKRDENHELAAVLFAQALEKTLPNFVLEDLEKRLLGEEELTILLAWLQEKMETDPFSIEFEGNRILSYIDNYCEDEEVKVNIYSKAAWVMGTRSILRKNYAEALEYTLLGEEILTENMVLMHLPQFLERILYLTGMVEEGNTSACGKEKEKKFPTDEMKDHMVNDTYMSWKKQRDALKQLYEEYNEPWETDSLEIWKRFRQQEMYLFSELVEQERKLLKHSQEKLADALDADQKTISRIETGKYKPKAGTFEKLKEYLKIDRDICTTRIATESFELLELERKITKLEVNRKTEEAERLYLYLKSNLSMKWKENEQYVKYEDAMFANKLRGVPERETLEACLEAFHITREGMSIKDIHKVVLSRHEAFILNYMAICCDEMGEKEKSIEIAEKVLKGYENSQVDVKYHYAAFSLLGENLADWYEESDRFEEAIEWCDKIIKLELKCKRGVVIPYLFAEKRYTMDRWRKENKDSKDTYRQAYQLMKLMKNEKRMFGLKQAFFKYYQESIE